MEFLGTYLRKYFKSTVIILLILTVIIELGAAAFFLLNGEFDEDRNGYLEYEFFTEDNFMVLVSLIAGTAAEISLIAMYIFGEMADNVAYIKSKMEDPVEEEVKERADVRLCPICKGVLTQKDIPSYSRECVCPHCKKSFMKDEIIIK